MVQPCARSLPPRWPAARARYAGETFPSPQPGGRCMSAEESEPTEEEMRAALEEQMRNIRVEDVVLQTTATLINLAGRRVGPGRRAGPGPVRRRGPAAGQAGHRRRHGAGARVPPGPGRAHPAGAVPAPDGLFTPGPGRPAPRPPPPASPRPRRRPPIPRPRRRRARKRSAPRPARSCGRRAIGHRAAAKDGREAVGVFGGSGFYSLLDEVEEVALDTPYGPPSAAIRIGRDRGHAGGVHAPPRRRARRCRRTGSTTGPTSGP